ncbi:hypothetical protein PIB30_018496 [Stylosanthes scabra]|uniref:Uncharacterized protein n=1 Tax=Stylosanthes scabra TaxID=79078 RepID=A0ABU6X852_9FABA|nr:hypothetical protein [Stylosanthes scabra]
MPFSIGYRHALAKQGPPGREAARLFLWTPYGSNDLRFLTPDWIHSQEEVRTLRSLIPIVCFNMVSLNDVDQLVLADPANLEFFLTTTSRREGISHDPGLVREMEAPCVYLRWCKDGCLDDPRVVALLADIRPTPFPSRPDIPSPPDVLARRHRRGKRSGGRQTINREKYEDESEEERLFDQFDTLLGESHVRSSLVLPPPQPTKPPSVLAFPEMLPAVIKSPDVVELTWEGLTSVELEDVWDFNRTVGAATHDITYGFRQRKD